MSKRTTKKQQEEEVKESQKRKKVEQPKTTAPAETMQPIHICTHQAPVVKAAEPSGFTRAGKTEFTSHYKQHKSTMNKSGGNIENIIAIRQKLHTHPEGGFIEFRTQQALIDALKSFGVKDEAIQKCAITGLVVDLQGTGPKASK